MFGLSSGEAGRERNMRVSLRRTGRNTQVKGQSLRLCHRLSFRSTWHISSVLLNHHYGGPHLTFALNRVNLFLAKRESLFTSSVGLRDGGIFPEHLEGSFVFQVEATCFLDRIAGLTG